MPSGLDVASTHDSVHGINTPSAAEPPPVPVEPLVPVELPLVPTEILPPPEPPVAASSPPESQPRLAPKMEIPAAKTSADDFMPGSIASDLVPFKSRNRTLTARESNSGTGSAKCADAY